MLFILFQSTSTITLNRLQNAFWSSFYLLLQWWHWKEIIKCILTLCNSLLNNIMCMTSSHTCKLLKKVRKLTVWSIILLYYHISIIVFDIIRKHVYLSLNWYHIWNGYEIMERIHYSCFWLRVRNEILQSVACHCWLLLKSGCKDWKHWAIPCWH